MAKLALSTEEKQAVNDVIDSGMIACGEVVSEFESAFAKYCGSTHGIATTSGTTALEVAIRALGLGKGDKILTTPYSFIASTNAIIYAGATPVFADIEPDTFLMNLDLADQILQEHGDIKALLIVHLFGRPCNMDRVLELVDKYQLKLIEDCAQSHGAEWKGQRTGSFGHVAAFSFYPTKNMTTGEGGIVLTSDSAVADKARMLISHGMKVRYYHEMIGYNYRMTNIAAAIGLCQLRKLPDMNNHRYANAKFYSENIHHELVRLPGLIDGHVYHQFTLQIEQGKRDTFIEYLTANGIGHGVFYPLSIPEQQCYAEMNFETRYSVTDQVKTKVVSIPIHPQLTREELVQVADTINHFKV